MPITILDYVKSKTGEKETYSAADFHSNGVDMLGGCERCDVTLGAFSAYPSKSGFWRCATCIGDTGYSTVDDFTAGEAEADRAVTWLLRLRQLQAEGLDFDTALARANDEAGSPAIQVMAFDPKLAGDPADLATADDSDGEWINCPACGSEIIAQIHRCTFECQECGAVYSL